MRDFRIFGIGTVLASAVFANACAPSGEAASSSAASLTADVAPRIIPVTAADFSFAAPDTVQAGMTTFKLENQGTEFHHVQAVRLTGGHTVADLLRAMEKSPMTPDWAILVGGPNTPIPGGESEATVNLEPGEYALLCVIPSKDGVPHVMKGMVRPLTVIPAPAVAAEPVADYEMSLMDYAFNTPVTLEPGRRTFKVVNTAAQPHEVLIAQLAPGKSAEDLLKWLAKEEGPPPGKPLGGTTMLTKGQVNYLTYDLEAGEYALICFIPDAKDGKPHFMHGMVRQIKVGA